MSENDAHASPESKISFIIEEIGRFPERLKQAIGGGSARAFAREAGLSETVLRQYLAGQSEPTRPALIAMARTACVSVEWLATGHARAPSAGHWTTRESPSTYGAHHDSEGYIRVPKYNVTTGRDEGLHSEQVVDHLAFKTEWLTRELGIDPGALVLVSARGDSMEPTISQGDLLLLDMSQRRVGDEAIYALVMEEGGVLAKRIQRLLDGMLSIRCDNPAYKEQLIPNDAAESLYILGRVVWVGRRL